ncbi:MAG TPA: hypothetical protein VGG42_15660 [Acidobacteriaceae bacterium]|jgi:hypothetical protein
MILRRLQLLFVVPLMAAALPATAADSVSAFVGMWKLDPGHSQLIDQMKVEAAGANRYSFNFSGDNVETIVTDGTDQPGLYGTTMSVTVRDGRHWKGVRKKDGHIQLVGLWELSPDGRTLTDDFTGYHDNGSTTKLHYIYQRIAGAAMVGGKPTFAGTWESTTEDVHSKVEVEVRAFEGDGLTFVNAGGQVVQSLHFDGKDYPGSGGSAPAGYVSSGRRISERAVERVDKVNGKVLYTQQIEVSPDGRVLTVTVHVPGREKPDVMVFDRE